MGTSPRPCGTSRGHRESIASRALREHHHGSIASRTTRDHRGLSRDQCKISDHRGALGSTVKTCRASTTVRGHAGMITGALRSVVIASRRHRGVWVMTVGLVGRKECLPSQLHLAACCISLLYLYIRSLTKWYFRERKRRCGWGVLISCMAVVVWP